MARRTWPGWLLPALLLLHVGCGSEGGLTFEAPSEEELRDRVHLEPTASLDGRTLPWVLAQADAATRLATAFVRFTGVYAASFANAGDDDLTAAPASEYARREGALTYSASGYISFSCPGADLEQPDYDFGSGYARWDSPGVIGADGVAPTIVPGSVFLLRFHDGCRVGEDVIGGAVYGVFEMPWVLAAEATAGAADGEPQVVRADIELGRNRLTIVIYDDEDDLYKLIVTHPEGRLTSATIYGGDAKCSVGMVLDPASGRYQLTDAAPRCDF